MLRIFLHTPIIFALFFVLVLICPELCPGGRLWQVIDSSEHQPPGKASGFVALGCSSSLLPSPCHPLQPHTTGPFQVAVKECRMTMFLFIHSHGQTETSFNSSMQSKTVRETVHRKKSRKTKYTVLLLYYSAHSGTYHYGHFLLYSIFFTIKANANE